MYTTGKAPNGRGCGSRSAGACYLCTGLGYGGQPVEYFVIDPVRKWHSLIDKKEFQRGFQLLPQSDGTNHVVIFVGESFYASPWTFVEEVRHFGASRKVPPTFPFDKITPGRSQMFFVHPKAYANPDKLGFSLDRPHNQPLEGCNFFKDEPELWDEMKFFHGGWHPTVIKKEGEAQNTACTFSHRDLACIFHSEEEVVFTKDDGEGFDFEIQAPSFTYEGRAPSIPNVLKLQETMVQGAFEPGIFLRLPITHFEAYQYAGDWSEKAQKAGYAVEVLDY